MAQQQDPTISRIREVRHLISEKFGHDPSKIVAYYMERQKDHEKGEIKGRRPPRRPNRGRT